MLGSDALRSGESSGVVNAREEPPALGHRAGGRLLRVRCWGLAFASLVPAAGGKAAAGSRLVPVRIKTLLCLPLVEEFAHLWPMGFGGGCGAASAEAGISSAAASPSSRNKRLQQLSL